MKSCYEVLIFYGLGIAVYVPPQVVTWMAIEDILSGSSYPSSMVSIACSTDIVGKMIAVFMINRMPLLFLMLLYSVVFSGGLLMLVLLQVHWRIIGVAVLGFSYGFGVVLFLRQSTNFEQSGKASSAFVSGGNISALIASIVYTGK